MISLVDWLRDRTPAPAPDLEHEQRLAQAALDAAGSGAFGPSPRFMVGRKRRRLAIRSANDQAQRRALRRAFKGVRPLRSTARPFEQDWRRRSEA